MAYLGNRDPGDLVHQPGAANLKISIPAQVTLGNLSVLSGAILPAFDSLIVKSSGTSQLGTVTVGDWKASGITETYGGTGQVAYTAGDILYSDVTNSLAVLPIGNDGETLQIASGIITWKLPSLRISSLIVVNVLDKDRFVMISGAPGSPTVNLPSTPAISQRHTIKDRAGTAATSGITVDGNGNPIDTLSSTTISADFDSVDVVFDGIQWNII